MAMHPVRKQKLTFVIAIVVASSVAVGLMVYAIGNSADFFYPVSEIVSGEAPKHKSIRAGGCVVPGTIVKAKDRLLTEFVITDGIENLKVTFDGLLPDIFDEGEAAVVTGKVDDSGVLVASQVLAKHDENYIPPEVADTMSDSEKFNEACKGKVGSDYGYGGGSYDS